LNAEGYKCTTDDLFKGLVGVAATKGTRTKRSANSWES
jgi:hypothetical protein